MKHYEVVCALIYNDEGKIFCCKRGPGKALEGYWEFPGGKVEPNEAHEETIVREIKEELKTTIGNLEYIGKSYYEYKDLEKPFSITLYGYKCIKLDGKLELTEHTESKWATIDEMKMMRFAAADVPFMK